MCPLTLWRRLSAVWHVVILDEFNNLWAQQDSERYNETKDLNVGHPLSHTDGYMRVDNDRFKAFVQRQEHDWDSQCSNSSLLEWK